MTYTEQFLELVKEHPKLPIVPMVESEVVADDCYTWWLGSFGGSKVTEYYIGDEKVHMKDDDEDVIDVLYDMPECQFGQMKDGRDIEELPDEELDKIYENLPWIKCIAVYITT